MPYPKVESCELDVQILVLRAALVITGKLPRYPKGRQSISVSNYISDM